MYGKCESSIRTIVKKEKEIRASVAVTPHVAKATATVRDKHLVKMEKALNLWIEDMNRKRCPVDGNVCHRTSSHRTSSNRVGIESSQHHENKRVSTVQ